MAVDTFTINADGTVSRETTLTAKEKQDVRSAEAYLASLDHGKLNPKYTTGGSKAPAAKEKK